MAASFKTAGFDRSRIPPHLSFPIFEVNNLKPFLRQAFPHSKDSKTPPEMPVFDDELMASFLHENYTVLN